MAIISAIVRFAQLIFAVIVLALSITAVRWQVYGPAPAASGYNAFVGAFALLTALIGLVAAFMTAIPAIAVVAFDGLTFIFTLAGGIAYAVYLKGVNCNAYEDFSTYSNPLNYNLLNGGYYQDGDNLYLGLPNNGASYNYSALKGRCNTALADTAFLFITCIVTIGAAVLAFMSHRRGRNSAI